MDKKKLLIILGGVAAILLLSSFSGGTRSGAPGGDIAPGDTGTLDDTIRLLTTGPRQLPGTIPSKYSQLNRAKFQQILTREYYFDPQIRDSGGNLRPAGMTSGLGIIDVNPQGGRTGLGWKAVLQKRVDTPEQAALIAAAFRNYKRIVQGRNISPARVKDRYLAALDIMNGITTKAATNFPAYKASTKNPTNLAGLYDVYLTGW